MESLRGIAIDTAGVYLLVEDVVRELRELAEQYDESGNPSASQALRSVADAWAGAGTGEVVAASQEAAQEQGDTPSDDLVARVEVYPDNPDDPRPKWHARPVDVNGRILYVTGGAFDQEYVIANAKERWPGKEVYLVAEYMVDTIWEEAAPAGVRSGHSHRRSPSPNRLWSEFR